MSKQQELSFSVMGLNARYTVKRIINMWGTYYIPQFDGKAISTRLYLIKEASEAVCILHDRAEQSKQK